MYKARTLEYYFGVNEAQRSTRVLGFGCSMQTNWMTNPVDWKQSSDILILVGYFHISNHCEDMLSVLSQDSNYILTRRPHLLSVVGHKDFGFHDLCCHLPLLLSMSNGTAFCLIY